VFPTASWTRWHGSRGVHTGGLNARSAPALELEGVPSRTSQDKRDAIAAALTACDYERDRFDAFGDIVVPPPCSSRALASFAQGGSERVSRDAARVRRQPVVAAPPLTHPVGHSHRLSQHQQRAQA